MKELFAGRSQMVIARGLNGRTYLYVVPFAVNEFTWRGMKFKKTEETKSQLPVYQMQETEEMWLERALRDIFRKHGYPDDIKNLLEPFDVSGRESGDIVCFRGIYAFARGRPTWTHARFMVYYDGGVTPPPLFGGPYRNCVRRETFLGQLAMGGM